jgi:hypothetical protein
MSHSFESSIDLRMTWRRPVSPSKELRRVKKQLRKGHRKQLMLWQRAKKRGEISLRSMRKLIKKGQRSMKSTLN